MPAVSEAVAAQRRAIDPVDTMWLHMDRPENLMVVDAVLLLDGPVDDARFESMLAARLVETYPVMRQRPVEPRAGVGMPVWEDDPDFDLSHHIRRSRLRRPGTDAQVARYAERQASVPLPRDRPLWQAHVLAGYRGDRAAVLLRFHHALADGIALAHVLLSLTDDDPEGDQRCLTLPPRRRRSGGRPGAALLRSGLGLPRAAVRGLADPVGSVSGSVRAAGAGVSAGVQTVGIVRKLLLGHNSPSLLTTTHPGVPKRMVWTPTVPLSLLKAIGRPTGATINDVVVAALSGVIRSYLEGRGEQPTDLMTMVPVNLRNPNEPLPRELGNKFALALLTLPIGVPTAGDRLKQAKRRMSQIKTSPEAMITFGLNQAIGRAPAFVERPLVDFFAAKAIGVLTNVPGPREQRWMAGTPLAGAVGWVPGSGNHVLGASVFSYGGTLRVGFRTDAGVVPDPERLVALFEREIEQLAQATGAVDPGPVTRRARRPAASRSAASRSAAAGSPRAARTSGAAG